MSKACAVVVAKDFYTGCGGVGHVGWRGWRPPGRRACPDFCFTIETTISLPGELLFLFS